MAEVINSYQRFFQSSDPFILAEAGD